MPPAILVNNLTKCYRLGGKLPPIWPVSASIYEKNAENYHWAVKDVNFEVNPGEALGIIGPNGAGKTTILKLLSKVTHPTSGQIQVNGRFSALIELGAGFHPDLTGRENVYLNGIILGMRRSEIEARFDQIVDFAGIGRYLDTPVKRYSSGMYARLGFSIAAHVDPDILLVDEVLAVGDYAFQVKCHARMDELRSRGTALILVSHNMDAVRRVCDRGLVMYRGEAIFQGTSAESVVAYSDAIREAAREAQNAVPSEGGLAQRVMTFDAEIKNVMLLDENGERVSVVPSGSRVSVILDISATNKIHQPIIALAIRTPDGQRVYATTTKWLNVETPDFSAGERWQVEYSLDVPLLNGSYDLSVNIGSSDFKHYYDRLENALSFEVVDSVNAKGIVDLDAEVRFQKLEPVNS